MFLATQHVYFRRKEQEEALQRQLKLEATGEAFFAATKELIEKDSRTRHKTLQAARDKANAIKTAISNDDLTALSLKGQDSVIYARAKNLISRLGVALDEVAKQVRRRHGYSRECQLDRGSPFL